jgi:hypothetical protein
MCVLVWTRLSRRFSGKFARWLALHKFIDTGTKSTFIAM